MVTKRFIQIETNEYQYGPGFSPQSFRIEVHAKDILIYPVLEDHKS